MRSLVDKQPIDKDIIVSSDLETITDPLGQSIEKWRRVIHPNNCDHLFNVKRDVEVYMNIDKHFGCTTCAMCCVHECDQCPLFETQTYEKPFTKLAMCIDGAYDGIVDAIVRNDKTKFLFFANIILRRLYQLEEEGWTWNKGCLGQ